MKKILALLLVGFIIFQLCAVSNVTAAKMPFTVMGKVTDRLDRPIAGATVKLLGDVFQVLGTTTTDENGNFEFPTVSAKADTVKVSVLFVDGQNSYSTEIQNTNWYSTDVGLINIDDSDTKLDKYPPPAYGYIWGIMQADGSNNRALGGGVVYVIGKDQYYTFTSAGTGNGKGTFVMHVPVGHYKVYGQYMENGMIFQSALKEIDVTGTNTYQEANPTQVLMPISAAHPNPVPSEFPAADNMNIISGTVSFKDGKPLSDQTVSLYESYDDGMSGFYKVDETKTDGSGYYQFYDAKVKSDPPNPDVVFASKKFYVSTTFTDPQGTPFTENKTFILYHPNVILGLGMEQAAHNPTLNLTVDYSQQGWVKVNSLTTATKLYVDNVQQVDSANNPVTFPYNAYMDPGLHTLTFKADGYDSKTIRVNILENQQTEDVTVVLDKSAFAMPSWVPAAVSILILLIVAGILIAVLYYKREMIMGPLAGVIKPIQSNIKNSTEARKVKKAQATEARKAEQSRMAQMREASIAAQHKLDGKKRDRELAFTAKEQARLPEHRGDDSDRPSMVTARDIYGKQDRSAFERVSMDQGMGSRDIPRDIPQRNDYTPREKPVFDADSRVRVPRSMPVGRDQPGSNMKDKEMVIRYIREHSDGVSFIQMSNDLEIPPNTLTIITKELVINDDIEKIKGLYYYKSHDSSGDEGKSSVVVWRLDGED